MSKKKKAERKYTFEELWHPKADLTMDAAAYGRQSTKEQYIENIQSHISQTVGLLEEAKKVGFKDDGSTGKVILFVENQVVDEDGNTQIKNASGTWPIDRRPDLKAILDLIEEDKIKLVIVEFIDRLFRDEDRIDSNIFIKACKDHGCYVYVMSKRMVFNLANPQMADMFRMEVQFAAMYIEHQVKGVMIGRKLMAARRGQYVGGHIPTGFIVCRDEKSKWYKHLEPYEPHAAIMKKVAEDVLLIGVDEYCKRIGEVYFPEFEDESQVGSRSLTKVGGGGYAITTRGGLISLLLNPANIGIMEHGDDIKVESAHLPIFDQDLYESLSLILKGNGTYYQRRTGIGRIGILKGLLRSSTKTNSEYAKDKKGYYYYKLYSSALVKTGYSIGAEDLESFVVKRLLELLQDCDLGNFTEELEAQKAAKKKEMTRITGRLEEIERRLDELAESLEKTKIEVLIQRIESKTLKLVVEKDDLTARMSELENEAEPEEENSSSVMEALALLDTKNIPSGAIQPLLKFLVNKIILDQMSSRYFRLRIVWKVSEWGTEEMFLCRDKASCTPWSTEEEDILKALYPTSLQKDLLENLPKRSWESIRVKASTLNLRRNGHSKTMWQRDFQMSYNDSQFLEEHGELRLEKWSKVSSQSIELSISEVLKIVAGLKTILPKRIRKRT